MASNDDNSLYDTIKDTATAFINGFGEAHKARDPSILSAQLAPSCRRHLAPAAFLKNAPQFAAGWSNAEYEQHMRTEIDGYSDVHIEINNLSVDVRKREAVVQSTHKCTMAADQRTWPFEFIFILRCDESGRRINEIIEFIDTATAGEMMAVYMPKDA